MSKIMLMVVASLFLTGCADDVKVIEVNSTNKTKIINESELFDLEISGINNTITILGSNKVRNIDMNGIKNSITIEDKTTVESFYLGGTAQTITIQKKSGIKFSGRPDLHNIIEL